MMLRLKMNDTLLKFIISQQNAHLKVNRVYSKKTSVTKNLVYILQKHLSRRNFRNKVRVCSATLFEAETDHTIHAGPEKKSFHIHNTAVETTFSI